MRECILSAQVYRCVWTSFSRWCVILLFVFMLWRSKIVVLTCIILFIPEYDAWQKGSKASYFFLSSFLQYITGCPLFIIINLFMVNWVWVKKGDVHKNILIVLRVLMHFGHRLFLPLWSALLEHQVFSLSIQDLSYVASAEAGVTSHTPPERSKDIPQTR